jgi:UDP-N-acetylglucosamine 2-epimerase (non-hydrolysing)
LHSELAKIVEGKAKSGTIPPLWDGHAGERIAEILCQLPLNSNESGTRSTVTV